MDTIEEMHKAREERDEARAEVERLSERVEKLTEVLQRVEWKGGTADNPECPVCYAYKGTKHYSECLIHEALK